MKPFRTLALLTITLSLHLSSGHPAWALSCVAPVMNEQVYEASDAIFIGQARKSRPPSAAERAHLQERHFAGMDPDKLRLYPFTVERAWKGAEAGTEVLVAIDSYWGDGFPVAKPVLIVADGEAGEILISPLCGLSRGVEFAGELIEALERIAP